jgi:hypothetical protein
MGFWFLSTRGRPESGQGAPLHRVGRGEPLEGRRIRGRPELGRCYARWWGARPSRWQSCAHRGAQSGQGRWSTRRCATALLLMTLYYSARAMGGRPGGRPVSSRASRSPTGTLHFMCATAAFPDHCARSGRASPARFRGSRWTGTRPAGCARTHRLPLHGRSPSAIARMARASG